MNEASSAVPFFMPFEDFTDSPVPSLDAYFGYRQRAVEFIESRNRRIAAYVAEHRPKTRPPWAAPRFEPALAHAEDLGQRGLLEELLAAGDRLGLYLRPYAASVMFTPLANRTRGLFTVSPHEGGMRIWVSGDVVEEFFPEIPAAETRRQLGKDGQHDLDEADIREFIAGLERLLHPTQP